MNISMVLREGTTPSGLINYVRLGKIQGKEWF